MARAKSDRNHWRASAQSRRSFGTGCDYLCSLRDFKGSDIAFCKNFLDVYVIVWSLACIAYKSLKIRKRYGLLQQNRRRFAIARRFELCGLCRGILMISSSGDFADRAQRLLRIFLVDSDNRRMQRGSHSPDNRWGRWHARFNY